MWASGREHHFSTLSGPLVVLPFFHEPLVQIPGGRDQWMKREVLLLNSGTFSQRTLSRPVSSMVGCFSNVLKEANHHFSSHSLFKGGV